MKTIKLEVDIGGERLRIYSFGDLAWPKSFKAISIYALKLVYNLTGPDRASRRNRKRKRREEGEESQVRPTCHEWMTLPKPLS